MDSKIKKHKYYKCNCIEQQCIFCDGELSLCTVCNGAEGTLTTHCCNRKITDIEEELIYQGYLDFKNNKWESHNVK